MLVVAATSTNPSWGSHRPRILLGSTEVPYSTPGQFVGSAPATGPSTIRPRAVSWAFDMPGSAPPEPGVPKSPASSAQGPAKDVGTCRYVKASQSQVSWVPCP